MDNPFCALEKYKFLLFGKKKSHLFIFGCIKVSRLEIIPGNKYA